MSLAPGQDTGAPLGFSGANITRLADADRILNNGVMKSLLLMTPTAPRALTLPLLSTVLDGDSVTVRNLAGAVALTYVVQGGDLINDGAGPITIAAGATASAIADIPNGTWITA